MFLLNDHNIASLLPNTCDFFSTVMFTVPTSSLPSFGMFAFQDCLFFCRLYENTTFPFFLVGKFFTERKQMRVLTHELFVQCIFLLFPQAQCFICVCVCVGKASGFNISVPMLLDSTGKPSKKLGRHRICMGDPWQVSRWWSDFQLIHHSSKQCRVCSQ